MPKKQKSVKKTTARVKASAKSIVNINIGRGKSAPKRQPKKAEVVQNVIRTSPTIYNPAPTPFQISAPQPKPFSSATEIAEEVRRLGRADYERAVQQREILRLPGSAVPTGAFVVEPQFNNMEVPTSFSQLETPQIETPAQVKRVRKSQKQIAQDRARMLGISTAGTLTEINERIGAFTREEEIVGMAKEMIKGGKEINKKDPFL
jgi:hypothetical protein